MLFRSKTCVPQTYGASTSWNYEVGFKGEFLDRRFSVDTSIYYIDWRDLQVQVQSPTNVGYTANAGAAKSEGVEFSAESRPLLGMTVSSWITYDDAALTEAFPPTSSTYGVPGNRLPYASRWSGHVSFQQEFPVTGQVSALLGGDASYVGNSWGILTGSNGMAAPRSLYPGYAKVDLLAGINYASWSAKLFVTNLTDRRATIGGGDGDYPPFAYQYITPRTVGLTVVKTF